MMKIHFQPNLVETRISFPNNKQIFIAKDKDLFLFKKTNKKVNLKNPKN